ncbi:MAG: hypothetical protein HOJ23_13935 [Gammaproteobacteria bacterium]|jgi:uncharacterized membrane protein|nr:hypothetical protein [Gammaproteobacteria bacterium]
MHKHSDRLAFALALIGFCFPVTALCAPDYAEVASLFKTQCVMCHNGPAAPKGLRLDSLENIKKGSQSGPVAIAGDAANSELVRRIRGQSQPRMPLTGPPYLGDEDIKRIVDWIDGGMKAANAAKIDQATATAQPKPRKPGDAVTYSDVAPIFGQRCIKCHHESVTKWSGGPPEGLSLQSYEHIIRGNDRVVVLPGSPQGSELDRRIRGIARPRMPFDGPPWLSNSEIDLISEWIKQGAKDANGQVARIPVGKHIRLRGRLTGRWSIDGQPIVIDRNTRIKKRPSVGDFVEVRGYVGQDGRIYVNRLRRR